jgi:hypothetical protein
MDLPTEHLVVLFSPAAATLRQLARALLAFHQTEAAPCLAAELHGRLHPEDSPFPRCRRCLEPTALLATLVAGSLTTREVDPRLVRDSLGVYTTCRQETLPKRSVIFRAAAALFLAGYADRAAFLAKMGHDEARGHWMPIWCPTCDDLLTGRRQPRDDRDRR